MFATTLAGAGAKRAQQTAPCLVAHQRVPVASQAHAWMQARAKDPTLAPEPLCWIDLHRRQAPAAECHLSRHACTREERQLTCIRCLCTTRVRSGNGESAKWRCASTLAAEWRRGVAGARFSAPRAPPLTAEMALPAVTGNKLRFKLLIDGDGSGDGIVCRRELFDGNGAADAAGSASGASLATLLPFFMVLAHTMHGLQGRRPHGARGTQ